MRFSLGPSEEDVKDDHMRKLFVYFRRLYAQGELGNYHPRTRFGGRSWQWIRLSVRLRASASQFDAFLASEIVEVPPSKEMPLQIRNFAAADQALFSFLRSYGLQFFPHEVPSQITAYRSAVTSPHPIPDTSPSPRSSQHLERYTTSS